LRVFSRSYTPTRRLRTPLPSKRSEESRVIHHTAFDADFTTPSHQNYIFLDAMIYVILTINYVHFYTLLLCVP